MIYGVIMMKVLIWLNHHTIEEIPKIRKDHEMNIHNPSIVDQHLHLQHVSTCSTCQGKRGYYDGYHNWHTCGSCGGSGVYYF